jgi:branched-chain amino acid transport system permease protein
MLSLAHAAFFGVGAYLSTLAQVGAGVPWLVAAAVGVSSAALLSLLVALPSLRLRGDYFVLASLGFQIIFSTVLLNWIPVTRGPYGIADVPRPTLGGLAAQSTVSMLGICTMALVATVICFRVLDRSPFGRALRALREDEVAAVALGKDVYRLKTYALAIASAFAGLAGVLYAGYMRFIDPSSFGMPESLFLVSMVVIGGAGNLRGPTIGTALMLAIPEILRFLSVPDAQAANIRQAMYGCLIVALMRIRPTGIAGEYRLR